MKMTFVSRKIAAVPRVWQVATYFAGNILQWALSCFFYKCFIRFANGALSPPLWAEWAASLSLSPCDLSPLPPRAHGGPYRLAFVERGQHQGDPALDTRRPQHHTGGVQGVPGEKTTPNPHHSNTHLTNTIPNTHASLLPSSSPASLIPCSTPLPPPPLSSS